MTVKGLVIVQINTHFSNSGVKKLASIINFVSRTKGVESNFHSKFDTSEDICHILSYKLTFMCEKASNNKKSKTVVYYNDLKMLLNEAHALENSLTHTMQRKIMHIEPHFWLGQAKTACNFGLHQRYKQSSSYQKIHIKKFIVMKHLDLSMTSPQIITESLSTPMLRTGDF